MGFGDVLIVLAILFSIYICALIGPVMLGIGIFAWIMIWLGAYE